eukprot:m.93487 g.93487  ORF g.93487 m.93487 type:complete len:108 (+) comp36785_c0_seq5:986-1309(+)
MKSALAVSGRNLLVPCPLKNTMPPETVGKVRCNWWKDGLSIPTDSEDYHHKYRPWLIIYNVTKSQVGQYKYQLLGMGGITTNAKQFSFVTVSLMSKINKISILVKIK